MEYISAIFKPAMPVEHSPVLSRKNQATLPGSADGDPGERRPPNSSQSSRPLRDRGGSSLVAGAVEGVDESQSVTDLDTGMEQSSSKTIGKLDESVYKIFGHGSGSVSSLSRSSSDTGSEGLICNGGPGKKNCGNPVKDGEAGVLCDRCHEWSHAACQGIPKAALKAMEKFESLAWLCPECKVDLKNKSKKSELRSRQSLENRISQLEDMIRSHLDMMSNSISSQEKAMRDQTSKLDKSISSQEKAMLDQNTKVEKALQSCEKYVKAQAKTFEQMAQQQRASYADTVKGTCDEMAKAVKTQLEAIPKANAACDGKSARDLSKALDDHMDRERRKANLVVHNLPEQDGDSLMERSAKDMTLFASMVKDVMKLNVTSSKSFRVGKKRQDKPRLLIITLDNPACKHDILKGAPQLRSSEEYSNIYITPDQTLKEREANKKLREELMSRRRAGEADLTIRGGKIVHLPGHARADRGRHTGRVEGTRAQDATATPAPTGSGHRAPAILGSGGREQQVDQPKVGGQGDGHPTVLCSGSGAAQQKRTSVRDTADGNGPAVLCSGGREQQLCQLQEDTQQGSGSPTVLGSGSGAAQSKESSGSSGSEPEGGSVLVSGSREQQARQPLVETRQGVGSPTVLGSGSEAVRSQRSSERPHDRASQHDGAPAAPGSGSRVQPTQQPVLGAPQGDAASAETGSMQSSTENLPGVNAQQM